MSEHDRLTPLDAAFLEVETDAAHMHVGWVITLRGTADRARPTFAAVRRQIESRLWRTPRYRQKLAPVPLGINDPVWIDDDEFDIRRHVQHSRARKLDSVVERVFSQPLDRDHPLWEVWVADELSDGRTAVVGKVHHCMVDGIAAVELVTLLFDLEADPEVDSRDAANDWYPRSSPTRAKLLVEGARDRLAEELNLLRLPARLIRSPGSILSLASDARSAVLSLTHSIPPAKLQREYNAPLSSRRRLGRLERSFDDLRMIRRKFDATVNDVVLAVAAGALRNFSQDAGNVPDRLKTMVPVSVRTGPEGALGNQISLVFISLPCDEPDPLRRLTQIRSQMSERKRAGEPLGARALVNAYSYMPHAVQHAFDRAVARPSMFNVVVSNIPGPRQPLYMLGCPVSEAYPIVPLAEGHALAVGFTTMGDRCFFGIYVDSHVVSDPGAIARSIDDELDVLLQHCA